MAKIKKQIKVLHAPTTVGGNSQTLSKALNVLNVKSVSLTLSQNYLQYPADSIVWSNDDGFFTREWKRMKAIFSELFEYDVIHFNFGTTMATPYGMPGLRSVLSGHSKYFILSFTSMYLNVLQLIELSLLRLLNKPMFVTYQGDDARQGDYLLANFEISPATQVDSNYYTKDGDRFKRRSIKRLAKYCDQIYSLNPDLLHVLPKSARFIPYSHILLSEWQPVYSQLEQRPLRILHAPSHRKVKGTDILLNSLNELKEQGFQFELMLIEGLSNAEARKMYEKADVLVDQLFAGWYGGLAVELMALGKPVLVYIREEDLKFIPKQMEQELPFIKVTPDSLIEALRLMLEMPRSELVRLGQRSRKYVEKWHDPLAIANHIKADYEKALIRRKKIQG